LPGGLWPSLTTSVHNIPGGRCAGGTPAGAASTGNRRLKKHTEERIVAQTRRPIRRTETRIVRDQLSGAGIVPGYLGNIGKSRRERRRIRPVPVNGIRAGV